MEFKALRENKLKISQEEFAEMLGVDVKQICEWDEKNNVSSDIIQKISEKTNLDFNMIFGYKKPKIKPLDVKNEWEKADFMKKSLADYVKEALEKMEIPEELSKRYVDDLRIGIDANLIKPSISIVGRSDTGKSTLINSLIGMEKMPTSWTPTTSIAVYIKHVNERPSFIKEDVWVFADSVGKERLWNSKRLDDEEYCKLWKINAGTIDILRSYGTRQGENYKNHAGSAVVFIDAPVLLNCDIVDLPGFGTELESDDDITFLAAQRTDVLIYLSQANGFMRMEDITYLKENVRNLPVWEKKGENELKVLSNLFIVASQAHNVSNGSRQDLDKILLDRSTAFTESLTTEYWSKRKEISGYPITNATILKRFFTYTTDIPSLCDRFLIELKELLEQLPNIIKLRTMAFIRDFVSVRKPNLEAEILRYETLSNERNKYVTLLDKIKETELQRIKENDEQKERIKTFIWRLEEEAKNEFSNYISSVVNTDAIVSKMKEKGIKNKKRDIECFASQFQDEIQDKCSKILESKAVMLTEEVKRYITVYSDSIQTVFDKSSVDIDFDARFAFASALAKLGIIGGLGAYIASEAAFMFGSLAFIAGVGGNIAWISSIFGPIGIVVGLVIATGLGLVKLFGGGWERSVAKKLVDSYEKNQIAEKYRSAIKKYWEDTEEAFVKAADKLDEEWEDYVKRLEEMVKEYDANQIKKDIQSLENIKIFFENIPL